VLSERDLFKLKPSSLSDEFSMVDATIAPIRGAATYEIDLPPQAQPIVKLREHHLLAAGVPHQPLGKAAEMRLA